MHNDGRDPPATIDPGRHAMGSVDRLAGTRDVSETKSSPRCRPNSTRRSDAASTIRHVRASVQCTSCEPRSFLNRELVGLDFSGADLPDARFEKTTLSRCNFAGTDLRGASFVLCELRGVVLLTSS